AALKETVFNGVSNLRYMDKILHEWNKKGYKTVSDVEISKQKYQQEQRQKEKLELFDYDWFDDDES
ncbi:MAG: DnaD domain protein, partial [Bacilli bacterium]|nr:DnaD domain protein [Bacilli bacterium]